MRFIKSSIIILITMMLALVLASCSGSSKNQSPLEPRIQVPDLPSFGIEDTSGRDVLAVYDAVIDPVAKTFTVTPAIREATYHFPLTKYYPNVVQVVGYGFDLGLWADIKLTHPLPESGYDVYDPRVIAIVPARAGVSFNYPMLNAVGNNTAVIYPDGYTKLFDSLGGSIPGNTNPFKAYFKNEPNRVWSSTGVISETQRWFINLAGFGGPMQYKLVVDISTNYPNPPQPVIDNAKEPVQLEAVVGPGLNSEGGSAPIDVTITDWQGASGTLVGVESPELFNGVKVLSYTGPGPNPDEYVFSGTITNLPTPVGDYLILVAALDQPSNTFIYDEVSVFVEGAPLNPVDVTPPWLNDFEAYDVFFEANLAYVAAGEHGLYIINVSDPTAPTWLNRVDTPGFARGVKVAGGYAYVADENAGLTIIDVEPISAAYVVNTVVTPASAYDVWLSGNLAYVAAQEAGVTIIDITDPTLAYVDRTIDTPGKANSVHVSGNYAYVADHNAGLTIIKLSTDQIIGPVGTPANALGVSVYGVYAYVAVSTAGLSIVDIANPEYPELIKMIDTPGSANDVHATSVYVYVADGSTGLKVISGAIVGTCDTPGDARSVYVSGDYAYMADKETGFQIIKITTPTNPSLESGIDAPSYSLGVDASGQYAYVVEGSPGVQPKFYIIDIDSPESANIVKSPKLYGNYTEVEVSGLYAHAIRSSYLDILSIHPPESAYLVKSVDFTGYYYLTAIDVSSGYAYVANNYYTGTYYYLSIVDIDPPGSAYKVKTVSTSGPGYGVHKYGDYAYVAVGSSGIEIFDVTPPESAFKYKNIYTSDIAYDIRVSGRYAYVAENAVGLRIIADPLESHYTVIKVDTSGLAKRVEVHGGYAYVVDEGNGIVVIDIYPPELADIVATILTPGAEKDVCVAGQYAYVADYNSGLRIIKLW